MNDRLKSLIFDIFQIGTQVIIYTSGPIIAPQKIFLVVQMFALLLLIIAAWEMRRTIYYRIPDVGRPNELVTGGIYAYIRNPMYLAQMLFSGALVVSAFSFWRFSAWIVLLVNFLGKIRYEEALLDRNFSSFSKYRSSSKRLVPFIY